MTVILRAASSLTTVTSEATSTGNGAPPPPNRNLPPPPSPARRLLSISKRSWLVRTESNVRRESIAKPDPPCVVCRGSGRVDCHNCNGRGRTNHVELAVLPKGEWPKWCKSCGGSGLGYCDRCIGTGEYRYIMGFKFMKKDTDLLQDNQIYKVLDLKGSQSFTELLLNDDDQSDLGSES
ncbi:hypothetical protein ABFS82_14G155300 [Erythranthe guttata]|uniref:Uncharacterized protein n=2 Tax=Erythranthe guttata TaxID=4155 RepID=A0A022RQH6_ERYGU|nr:PREDICTED: uncharacterized protein LOC105952441 [Erythranthe guttata]EYU42304.1 hypothetical protein MIMGU_mgv1a014801mg [Erythranthe guttata]|eukprot:XP_012831448.1 PREDICTED: uncharacterized protein LOC105952441 [Erythranthe guttata]